MPTLAVTDFNIVCAVLGGFVLLFGLVSYFVKERLYLSEALIALLVGIALGPHGANFIRPLRYADGSDSRLDAITLAFTRLVLGVQLVLAGVQLPKKYLLKEWRSLFMLLVPIMTLMWVVSSLLIWVMVKGMSVLHALVISACITPTDPILSNNIVKGKFADAYIPVPLQRIIIAESGANDGLGYPFLFAALYFIKYCQVGSPYFEGGAKQAVGQWFGETMGYTIVLSVAYGTVVGWQAKELLHWAETRKLVDRESFLVFAIALALFIVGSCGMLGTDDVLACFVAGNVFTLDDWFRLETLDDSLQPTVDMLLNISVFLWFGAVIPWDLLAGTPAVPLSRLVPLAVLVIVLRRLPIVVALHRFVPGIGTFKEGLFAGYFGPIGVSAVFYLYVTLDFLESMSAGSSAHAGSEVLSGSDTVREAKINYLVEVIRPVVWICVLASVVVHGVTVPVMKLGNAIPNVISLNSSRFPTISSVRRSFSTIAVNEDGGAGAQRPQGAGGRVPDDEEAQAVAEVGPEVGAEIAMADVPTGETSSSTTPLEKGTPPTLRSPASSPTLPNFSPRSQSGNGGNLEEELEKVVRSRRVKIVEAKKE